MVQFIFQSNNGCSEHSGPKGCSRKKIECDILKGPNIKSVLHKKNIEGIVLGGQILEGIVLSGQIFFCFFLNFDFFGNTLCNFIVVLLQSLEFIYSYGY